MTLQPDPPAARADRWRLLAALAVFAVWLAVTVLVTTLASPGRKPLVDLVGRGPGWGFLAALLFLLGAVHLLRWRDMGLVRPRPGTARLLALPMLYVVFYAGLALRLGLPEAGVLGWIAANTLLVALSEELMFRGILLRALLGRLSAWPAVAAASLAFGAIHLLNAFGTGQPGPAAVQAVAATMSGFVLAAIVLRTGSLAPAILYHWLWNLGAFAVAASPGGGGAEAAAAAGPQASAFAIFFILPNFLYALFLLRKVEARPLPPRGSEN